MPIIFRAKGVGEMRAIACVGDKHRCPQYSDHGPHVGGLVQTGSSFISFNGRKVARHGDYVACRHANNHISTGVENITINGIPIATEGDATAHGGVILQGSSAVFIEDIEYFTGFSDLDHE